MSKKLLAWAASLLIIISATSCAKNDLELRSNGQNFLDNPVVKFLQGTPVSVIGEAPFSISGADPTADATAAAQVLADDITQNARIKKVKLRKKLKRFVRLTNTSTEKNVKKKEDFGLTATVASATNDNGTITGLLSITVNGMTAQAKDRLIAASIASGNTGFKKLSKASFVIVDDNLSDSTVDALIAGDPVGQGIAAKLKGRKVTTKTLFVPFF